ncbi:MAG: hypothetical protein QW515_04355 [Thermoplasmatales archaeon]
MADEKYTIDRTGQLSTDGKLEEYHRLKLLVSFNDIEFSSFDNGYYEVIPGVFFSVLLYLLYVKNVKAGDKFELAKDKARAVLISDLEKKKEEIVASSKDVNSVKYASRSFKEKVYLLDRAISYLKGIQNFDSLQSS